MKTISKSAPVLLLLCAAAWPMAGQTAETSTTSTRTTTTTTTGVRRPMTHIVTRDGGHAAKGRAYGAATRLAALLHDMQGHASLSPVSWKSLGNEAGALADRVVANAGGNAPLPVRKAAREARNHVRELRDAARNGDASGAQSHAREAQPLVYQVIEWSGTTD